LRTFPVARYLWKGAHNLRKRLSQAGVASSSSVVRLPKGDPAGRPPLSLEVPATLLARADKVIE
jgi:hypothetical protein